jgi:NhaA family Na+:H+ antiporter
MNRAFTRAVGHPLVVPLGAAVALVWVTLAAESYFRFSNAFAFAVNDVGMSLFFALITQEVLEATMPGGALHTWRRATLPIVAAIGGTIGAIGVYQAYVSAGDEPLLAAGWPIVCAIDGGVAYLLVTSLVGAAGARPFVLLMVIVSNAIGLSIIGVHQQATNLHVAGPFLIAGGIAISVALMRLMPRVVWPQLVIGGTLTWWGFWWSGLHPALALMPIVPFLPRTPRGLDLFTDKPHGPHDSPRHLEHWLRAPVQVVLMLFALVNAGTIVRGIEPGTWAVPAGTLVGRPLGMLVAVGVAIALGLRLPAHIGWRELVVVAFAVSCSFTFGLFFATAVFPLGPVLMQAKVGALSTIAGALVAVAAAVLLRVNRRGLPD